MAETGRNITIGDINIAGPAPNTTPPATNPKNTRHQFVAEGKKPALSRSASKNTASGI